MSGPVLTTSRIVLKFGSSVLDGPAGFRGAAAEIAGEIREGRRVVAVVSASPGRTEALLGTARRLCPGPEPTLLSRLLATGEEESAALLAICLGALGIGAEVLDTRELGIVTRGPVLDGEPISLDADGVREAVDRFGIVVVPGFTARDAQGRYTTLGRGGSDLTALYLAEALSCDCRLVKDVNGLYPTDPSEIAEPVRPHPRAHWDEVKRLGSRLVQEKALTFARERGLSFTVATLGGSGTRVGAS